MNINIKQQLTTVTTFSKIVAGILFIALPFIGFYLGMQYGKEIKLLTPTPKPPDQVACTLEAKICPDGSSVGRTGLNCEFAACPNASGKTVDWKNYDNSQYGFKISFPETAKLVTETAGLYDGDKLNLSFSENFNTATDCLTSEVGCDDYSISMLVYEKGKEKSYLEQVTNYAGGKFSSARIGKYDAMKSSKFSTGEGGFQQRVAISGRKYVYVFTYGTGDNNKGDVFGKHLPIFTQFLSSVVLTQD